MTHDVSLDEADDLDRRERLHRATAERRTRENARSSAKNGAPGQAPSRPSIISAASLMAKEFPPPKELVPGYISEGCVLLAGRPKIGKSWLVTEIGIGVASGGTCLGGIECASGSVLYLALEDNERRLQRRLRKLLFAGEDAPARLHYSTVWPRTNEGGVEEIRNWVQANSDARLVIVDVLNMVRPPRGRHESPYEADYAAVKVLQELSAELGITVIIVLHLRKGAGEADPFEKVSGTLGLSGAADSVLILDRDAAGTTLYGRGRDMEEVESSVIFDKMMCRWKVQGEVHEVRRSKEQEEILNVLQDASELMTPAEIAIAVNRKRNSVDQMLLKLGKEGLVVRPRRGFYAHTARADLVGPERSKNDKK